MATVLRLDRLFDFWRLMKKVSGWILGFLLVASGAALAQGTNSGDVRGTVTDSNGALLPGVKVTVVNVDTGVTKELTTDSAGLYDTSVHRHRQLQDHV